jgi:hypothetical protein
LEEEKTGNRIQPSRWPPGGQFDRTRNLMASQEALLVVTPAKAGVQKTIEKLDSRLRGNDIKRRLLTL